MKIKRPTMHKKTTFMAVVFIASVVVLGIKLLNPTPVQIFVENETAIVNQIPGLFTYADALIMIITTSFASISGMYLLFFNSSPQAVTGMMVLEQRKKHWKQIAKTLKSDEQKIYEAIIGEGIIAQSDLVVKKQAFRNRTSVGHCGHWKTKDSLREEDAV